MNIYRIIGFMGLLGAAVVALSASTAFANGGTLLNVPIQEINYNAINNIEVFPINGISGGPACATVTGGLNLDASTDFGKIMLNALEHAYRESRPVFLQGTGTCTITGFENLANVSIAE